MTSTIAIRTDGSIQGGLGHVKRCLSLAHALRRHRHAVCFVVRGSDIDVGAMVIKEGHACVSLPAPEPADALDGSPPTGTAAVGWQTDAQETVAALNGQSPAWLVVDHYALDARWHSAVRSRLRCPIGAIDDLADRSMDVDLLVDHNIAEDHGAKYAGRLVRDAIILGGPTFALLGPEYASAPRYACREEVTSIGIFMGGTDAADLSGQALSACRQGARFKGEIEVVTTGANPNIRALRAQVDADPHCTLTVDLPQLSDFYRRHDVQVGASGGASWERCCIGAPTVAVIAAENQRQVQQPLAQAGAVLAIDATPPPAAEIARAVRMLIDQPALRYRLSNSAQALVDGLGAERVAVQLINAVVRSEKM